MEEPTFGDLLREHLQARKMSYEQFASKLGVHKSTVSRWVSNWSKPEFEQLKRIPRVLKLNDEQKEALLRADGREYSITDLPFNTPEPNEETKPETSKQKVDNSGNVPDVQAIHVSSSSQQELTEPKVQHVIIQSTLSEVDIQDQNNRRALRQMVKKLLV